MLHICQHSAVHLRVARLFLIFSMAGCGCEIDPSELAFVSIVISRICNLMWSFAVLFELIYATPFVPEYFSAAFRVSMGSSL